MVTLNYSIDDAKALAGMLDLVVKVMGQNLTADNAEGITAEVTRASAMRKTILVALQESEAKLAEQVKEAAKPAPEAPASVPAAPVN